MPMQTDTDEGREASDPRTPPSRLGQLARRSNALALLVARNTSATPKLLLRLARRDDRAIREAVCEHPATPEAVVHALADALPEAFARGLWGREFLATGTHRAPRAHYLRKRLAWPGAPPAWAERASVHPLCSVRLAAAGHAVSLSESALARLAEDVDVRVRAALARRADVSARWAETLARDPDPLVRRTVASRKGLPRGLIVALAHDPDRGVVHAAAMQPDLPLDEMPRLADEGFAWALVANPSTPTRLLLRCANPPPDEAWRVERLASHPNADEAVLAGLLTHPSAERRRAAVSNARSLSLALWERVTRDPDEWVRWSLGYRKDAPVEVLVRFAASPCAHLRASAASNARTPAELVARLARAPAARVRSAAAVHPEVTADTLHALARDPERSVRESVAKHAKVASVLVTLGGDAETSVRVAVRYNPATPPDLRRALENDPSVRAYYSYY